MDTYGHLLEGSDRESAERMQRIFGSRAEVAITETKVVPIVRPEAS